MIPDGVGTARVCKLLQLEQRPGHPVFFYRLQQVVDRERVESLDGILFEVRGEDHIGMIAQGFQHVESEHVGQLNIEKDHLRLDLTDQPDCIAAVARLARNADKIGMTGQQLIQQTSCGRLVLDDYGFERLSHGINDWSWKGSPVSTDGSQNK